MDYTLLLQKITNLREGEDILTFPCDECGEIVLERYIAQENHRPTMEATCQNCGATYSE